MNSIAIIIILMISLLGIGSLFWIRQYYSISTRTVNKELLKQSITNLLTSKEEEEIEDNNSLIYASAATSSVSLGSGSSSSSKPDSNLLNRLNNGGNNITGSIKKLFNNEGNGESRLQSLKAAINDTVSSDNKNNSNSNTATSGASISPTFINVNSDDDSDVIIPYTYENENSVEESPIIPESEVEEVELSVESESEVETPEPIIPETEGAGEVETETEIEPEVESDVIYTENAINNKKFPSAEEEVQEAIKKSNDGIDEDSDVITPIHTQQEREILSLYDDNETMTPYDDFEYKDSDQKKIENASNRIDKFYERLSGSISINKITGKNNNEEVETESKGLNKSDNTYTQTVFKTDDESNKLSNETIVPYQHEKEISNDDTITPITSQRRTLNRSVGLTIQTKINNKEVTLKAGDTVIFNHNNETYSSIIIDVRPDEVYVNYRHNRVWISPDSIKKKFD